VIIAGIVVACLLGVSAFVWIGIRWWRKRANRERDDNRASAFLTSQFTNPSLTVFLYFSANALAPAHNAATFSRTQMNPGVVMPSKTILRPNATKEEIIQHHQAEGTLPRPFAPFMSGGGSRDSLLAPPTPMGDKRGSTASWMSFGRNSFLSTNSKRFSVMSAATTSSSIRTQGGGGGVRKVRQTFNPVLPDELVISVGERVNIVNSYDDGWCIVGRDGLGGTVELGAVPAWCFIKPSPGLLSQRPLRTTSLGVTINMDEPSGPRQDVISWSNF
ncbi:hypothetical protein K474DRAFT_1562172, partial [Panus rudis PR-1116 ss-1]